MWIEGGNEWLFSAVNLGVNGVYHLIEERLTDIAVCHQIHGQRGVTGLVGRLQIGPLPEGEAVALVEGDAPSGQVVVRHFHFDDDRSGQLLANTL